MSLINNSGVAYDLPWFPTPWPKHAAADTVAVNLYGAERLTRTLLLLNVSSGGGRANMSKMSESNRKKLMDDSIRWNDIRTMADMFVQEYEDAATLAIEATSPNANGKHCEQLPFLSPSGFWLQSFGFSKACLGSYTQILARQHPSILSICCSPSFIATDMSKTYPKYDTLKTIDEGGAYVSDLAIGQDKESLQNGVFYQPGEGVVPFSN